MKSKFGISLLISISASAYADTPMPANYVDLLAAQKRCDPAPWQAVNWEPTFVENGGSVSLNPFGEWFLIDSLAVTASKVKVNTKKKFSEQIFRVSMREFGSFVCQVDKTPSFLFERPRKFSWTVETDVSHSSDHHVITYGDGSFVNLLKEDSEKRRPIDGWKCYSDYHEFLRDPSVVDVEKLCAGQDESKKQEVRNEIQRVAEMLREKRYSECKKKKPHLDVVPLDSKAWIDGPANVRVKASGNSAIAFELSDNDQVAILQKKGNWYLIKSGDKQGWTAKQNLLPQSVRAECRDWER